MSTTFTPGPWFARPKHKDASGYPCVDVCRQPRGFSETVASAWGGGNLDRSVQANGRLIAAAPELYAVVRRYVEACLAQDIFLGGITGDAQDLLKRIDEQTQKEEAQS